MDPGNKQTCDPEEKEKKKTILSRFVYCIQSDKDFTPYKLLYASIYGAGGCLIPYITLYYKQLGFSAVETGVLVSIRPICLALISPIWGFLADRYQRRRLILFMGAIAWMLKTMLILAVQPKHQECVVTHINNSLSKNPLEENILRERRSLLDSNILNRVFNWKMFVIKSKAKYKLHEENKRHFGAPGFIKTTESRTASGGNAKKCNFSRRILQRKLEMEHKSIASSKQNGTDEYTVKIDQTEMVIIFYIILALTIAGEMFSAMLYPVADGCLVDCVGEQRSRYGRVRLWSSLVVSLATFIIGVLINESTYYSCGQAHQNYNIAFYFFAGLMTLGFLSIFCIKIVYCKSPDKASAIHGVKRLFASLPKVGFWITSISLGMLDGFQTEFTSWFLDDLEASSFIVGLAASLHYAFNAVIFFVANFVLNLIGYQNAISASLAVYVVIFMSFSFTQAPWLGLLLHVLAGSCFAISWTASVAYVGSQSSSAGLGATAQGILFSLYMGAGIGGGCVLGGTLISYTGIRTTYQVFAGIAFLVLVSYNALLCLGNEEEDQSEVEYRAVLSEDPED